MSDLADDSPAQRHQKRAPAAARALLLLSLFGSRYDKFLKDHAFPYQQIQVFRHRGCKAPYPHG